MTERLGSWACRLAPVLFGAALVTFPLVSHAGLALELQPVVRASTFEVVQKKPVNDPLTYEKPLPLDLIPYIERTDLYRSIGTAFALGQNQYVTAAHVLLLGINSQFGAPALRAADGKVYLIDRILKFSAHADFVVFSLKDNPASTGFSVSREPKIDTAVYAVGNALGEGIVIRDGAFTSETPEEQDGAWKWIRFSAAASPGNSGGPLLDESAHVVGIVLRKSANENLNYGLPITLVLDAPNDKAVFDLRNLTSLPYMRGKRTYAFKDSFKLPLTWPEFAKAYDATLSKHFEESIAELQKNYADTQFARGVGVDTILYVPEKDFLPRIITQQSDDTWTAAALGCCATNLPDDGIMLAGQVNGGAVLFSLHRSANASDDKFYGDSKAFMDIALKGLALTRPVGTDQVRITSLGSAQSDTIFTDRFGRVWQSRTWAVPHQDLYVLVSMLPTPDGYAGVVQIAPAIVLHQTQSLMQLLSEQFTVSYAGTPAQWQAFLKRSALLPKPLTRVTLVLKPEQQLKAPRFEFSVPEKSFHLGEQSRIGLLMGFLKEGPTLTWDALSTEWSEDAEGKSSVGLYRSTRPPSTAKLELRNRYAEIVERHAPYDQKVVRETADQFVANKVLDVPGKRAGSVSADVVYEVGVKLSGPGAYGNASRVLTESISKVHILEHGIGEDAEPYRETASNRDANPSESPPRSDPAAKRLDLDSVSGHDLRGRKPSDDSHEFIDPVRADPAEASKRSKALWDYWTGIAAERNNRELWDTFIEKNGFHDQLHTPIVLTAESRLLSELKRPPTEEWSWLSKMLAEAYVEERTQIAKSHSHELPKTYIERQLPCPTPPEKSSSNAFPSLAKPVNFTAEFYPMTARRANIEGFVLLAVQVDANGCGKQKGIVVSSGSETLDNAALGFVDSVEFLPAQQDGRRIAGVSRIPIRFKLSAFQN